MKKLLINLFSFLPFFASAKTTGNQIKIGIVLFQNLDQLDVAGPYEVFSDFPNTKVYLISNSLSLIKSSNGLIFKPNSTFKNTPQLDVLFVPGGFGVADVVTKNKELIQFVNKQSEYAKYVSSVCTGSLILASAGELKGYRATSHWLAKKYLANFGAIPAEERVVVDQNRITGAGVTTGVEVALKIGDLLFGKEFVEKEQLVIEYTNPSPLYPIQPNTASPETLENVKRGLAPVIEKRDKIFGKSHKSFGVS